MQSPTPNSWAVDAFGTGPRPPGTMPSTTSSSGYGFANVSPITPGADLRGTQITPTDSGRTQTTMGQVNQAAGAVAAGPGYTPFQSINPNDRYTAQADDWAQQAFGGLGAARGAVANTGFAPGTGAPVPPTVTSDMARLAFGTGGAGASGVNYGADTTAARAGLSQSLAGLEGPDRVALAREAFNILGADYEPTYQKDMRDVKNAAAATGRIGAGTTTSALGDVAQRKNEFFARRGAELANIAAGQTLADRVDKLNAARGVFGDLAGTDATAAQIGNAAAGMNTDARFRGLGLGADLAREAFAQGDINRRFGFDVDRARNSLAFDRAGLERGLASDTSNLAELAFGRGAALRGEQRSDRDARFRQEDTGYGRSLDRLGILRDLETSQAGRDAAFRNELRGERGYQDDLEQRGVDRAMQQRLFEESLLDRLFGRDNTRLSQLEALGFRGDPTRVLAEGMAQDTAAAGGTFGGVADLLEQLFSRQRPRGNGGGRSYEFDDVY
jgi:hypothetical protein